MRALVQKSELSETESMTSNRSSFIMPDKDIYRAKKRKKTAFQSFLTKLQPESSENTPIKRKLSDHQIESEASQISNKCKICSNILNDKVKLCQFCKDTLCVTHFRKARRNPITNKFNRICDSCQDMKLMEKYHQNMLKSQQTLVSEEIVVKQKYTKTKQQLQGKVDQLKIFSNKIQSTKQSQRVIQISFNRSQQQIDRLIRQTANGQQLNRQQQKRLNMIQKRKPRSQQKDFRLLQMQQSKLNKELSKIKKEYEHFQKAKTQLQKKMYEDLYEWQLMQKYKMKQQKRKDNQCNIY